MKKVGLLLILLVWLTVACGSGGTDFTEQLENEEPIAAATAPPSSTDLSDEGATEGTPPVDADDPTQARERDWKLGNADDPALTIIEYGDFQ